MGKNRAWLWASVLFVVIGMILIGVGVSDSTREQRAQNMPPFTATAERLIPNRTVMALTPPQTITTAPSRQAPTASSSEPSLYQGRTRWGVGVAIGPISRYNVSALRLGWYLDWNTNLQPSRPDNAEYAQMVRLVNGELFPATDKLTLIARANPGSLWLIGNEPDVMWQDNTDPPTYARLYAQAYQAIKSGDPTAQVAIGGVSQPTPLRVKYLEAILASYRQQFNIEMPIDVWNIHNFILREERGAWGVDIPPGMSEDRGILYAVDDSGNLAAFQKQIVDFRRWMSEHGYRNYPLIVSEYGIPMPEDYGFPPERVAAFLIDTFDFLLGAKDPALGYSADNNRLVQRWCWYSLDDTNYATGRLFDRANGKMTEFGKTWQENAARH